MIGDLLEALAISLVIGFTAGTAAGWFMFRRKR